MKKNLLHKIEILTTQAKGIGKKAEEKKESAQATNSLADTIKTKEQAEVFKRMLKSLQ